MRAHVATTRYGTVFGEPDRTRNAVAVRLYGQDEPSPGFVYSEVEPAADELVRVMIDPRGDRYVDAVFGHPASRPRTFNVRDFGGKLDGVADDTVALQATIDAARASVYLGGAGGKVVFGGQLRLTSPIEIAPLAGQDKVQLDIEGIGSATILWDGGGSRNIIHAYGWKASRITNVDIVIGHAVATANVVAWALDDADEYPSTGFLTFADCEVLFFDFATSCTAWRGGSTVANGAGGAPRDPSFMNFDNCMVASSVPANGNAGWVIRHSNVLDWNWLGGYGLGLAPMFRAEGTATGSMNFFGTGASLNVVDYRVRGGNASLNIFGGRYEVGGRFIEHDGALTDGSTVGGNVNVIGADIHAYNPADGILFTIHSPMSVLLDHCNIVHYSALYGASMIKLGGATTGKGVLSVRGGQVSATDPFWTVVQGDWQVRLEDVQAVDTVGQALARFAPRNPDRRSGVASVANGANIAHGLGRTPASYGVTPYVAGRIMTVYAVDATYLYTQFVTDAGIGITVAENVAWWVAG